MLRLFANGENGFLFGDYGDLTRLFTTSVGPTQVAANDDPVGLMLDHSKWGGKTLAQLVAAQSDLVVNGDFSVNANWTLNTGITISGGNLVFTAAGAFAYCPQNISLVADTWYRVSFDIVEYTSGAVRFDLGGGAQVIGAARSAVGTYVEYVKANTGNIRVGLQTTLANTTLKVDNVSVKAVAGNHARAAAGLSSQRPLWKANAGKPYLSWDGGDDVFTSALIPATAGALFFAGNPIGTGTIIGASDASSTNRCAIQINTNGQLGGGIGSANNLTIRGNTDVRGTNVVGVLTWNGSLVELWQSGTKVYSDAQSGAPTVAQPFSLGGVNVGGSPGSWLQHAMFAAGYLNRKPTDAEVALITSQFQQRF